MAKLSRTKGRAFEQWVAAQLRAVYPDARREWQAQQQHGHSDVAAGPFAVECKDGRQPPFKRALEQAEANAREGQIPIAVCHWYGDAREESIVAMRLGAFLRLVKQ